jgi:hypothetical protein
MKQRLLLSVTAGLLLMAGLPPPATVQRSVQEGVSVLGHLWISLRATFWEIPG